MLSKIADIKSYNYGMAKRWQWEKAVSYTHLFFPYFYFEANEILFTFAK